MARPRRVGRRHPVSGPVALAGRVALVTGAARGIGRAIALALAREGADVACADLLPAEDTARAVRALDRRAIALKVDVSRPAHARRMIAETVRRLGGLDILVNNAGITHRDSLGGTSERTWDLVVGVVLKGTFLCCQAAAPAMRRRGGGKIVNISSGTPFRGVPFLLHYVTSKGAIVAFTRALAKELGRDGIHVNCVAPGFTITTGVEEHPEVIEALREVSVSARTIQRDQLPEDVVGAVTYFCGPGSDFVTGQTIVIDGGQTFH